MKKRLLGWLTLLVSIIVAYLSSRVYNCNTVVGVTLFIPTMILMFSGIMLICDD